MKPARYNVYNYGKEHDRLKIKHKYSPNEYQEKRSELQENLDAIQDQLESCLVSPLKVRILGINITNILNAIEYYYNSNTERELANINKKYRESAKQIVKLTRFIKAGENTEHIVKNVYKNLEEIISDLKTQRQYISVIEQEQHEMKQKANIPQ